MFSGVRAGRSGVLSVPRWALRLMRVTALIAVLIAQPLIAVAEAGWRDDSRCCCPSPAECHCPGHDGHGREDVLRKCGNSGQLEAPVVPVLVAPSPWMGLSPVPVNAPSTAAPRPLATQILREPETPPF